MKCEKKDDTEWVEAKCGTGAGGVVEGNQLFRNQVTEEATTHHSPSPNLGYFRYLTRVQSLGNFIGCILLN